MWAGAATRPLQTHQVKYLPKGGGLATAVVVPRSRVRVGGQKKQRGGGWRLRVPSTAVRVALGALGAGRWQAVG